jgi:hypothetical protein
MAEVVTPMILTFKSFSHRARDLPSNPSPQRREGDQNSLPPFSVAMEKDLGDEVKRRANLRRTGLRFMTCTFAA